MGPVHAAFEVIDYHIRRNPTKIGEHSFLDTDEGGKLLVQDELPKDIRTERQNP